MEKDFVTLEFAQKLKTLGFKECVLTYFEDGVPKLYSASIGGFDFNTSFLNCVSRPTYSQSFRFLRKKYDLHSYVEEGTNPRNYFPVIGNVSHKYNPELWFETYEDAENACLEQLIEIAATKNL